MKKTIKLLLALVLAAAAALSGWKIWRYTAERRQSAQYLQTLAGIAAVPRVPEASEEAPAGTQTDAENAPSMPHMSENADAEDVIPDGTMPDVPLTIDFAVLQDASPDIIAWIYSEGTPISYPVVRSADNQDYLRRLPDGSYSSGGSIFLDCRCAADFSEAVSIIYGHNMKNDTMFGTLPAYREQAYYDAHPCLWLFTPEQTFRLDVLAGMETGAASEIYSLDAAALAEITAHSDFQSQHEPETDDRLLLLSTCSYTFENARYVLLCRLTPCRTDAS